MAREFSDGDHVGCFLKLDRLLVNKGALVVHDHVWVQRAVLGSIGAVRSAAVASEVSSRSGTGKDARATAAGESKAREAALDVQMCDVATGLAGDVEADRSGAQHARRDDNARQPHQARDRGRLSFALALLCSCASTYSWTTYAQFTELHEATPTAQLELDLGHFLQSLHAVVLGHRVDRRVQDPLGEVLQRNLKLFNHATSVSWWPGTRPASPLDAPSRAGGSQRRKRD